MTDPHKTGMKRTSLLTGRHAMRPGQPRTDLWITVSGAHGIPGKDDDGNNVFGCTPWQMSYTNLPARVIFEGRRRPIYAPN